MLKVPQAEGKEEWAKPREYDSVFEEQKAPSEETPLVAQGLRARAPSSGAQVPSLGRRAGSHMLQLKILRATAEIRDPAGGG